LLRGHDKPELIKDTLGYNTGRPSNGRDTLGTHWVGDLMLECAVKIDKAEGELWLELSRASDRFQARFDLATGQCQLVRLPKDGAEVLLGQPVNALPGPGQYSLRLANFDERLTLWVNETLAFGAGVEYPASASAGPVPENDLQPAGIAAKNASVTVSGLKLWRDTFYATGSHADLKTFYIHKDHYLCLGDNSTESSDGRMWGMVPNRLMLGRALLVYFPFQFPGVLVIPELPVNRVGIIH
jgi:signal peptidase I